MLPSHEPSSSSSDGRLRKRLTSLTYGLLIIVGIVVVWSLVKYGSGVTNEALPAPMEVARAAWVNRGALIAATGITLEGALGGFFFGSVAAVGLAIVMASSPTVSRTLMPIVLVIRTTPVIAIAPLLTLVLGNGIATIFTVTALIIFFPTMVNAVLGLQSVPPGVIEPMAIGNASRRDVLWRVRLPNALPFIFSGLQIGASTCILGAMVAEWIATESGLGYMILQAGAEFDIGLLWAAVLVAGLAAFVIFMLTGWVARRVTREGAWDEA